MGERTACRKGLMEGTDDSSETKEARAALGRGRRRVRVASPGFCKPWAEVDTLLLHPQNSQFRVQSSRPAGLMWRGPLLG